MPELPDIAAYLHALKPRILGERLERLRIASPFLLRSVDVPVAAVEGCRVVELRRIGKRIAIGVETDLLSDTRTTGPELGVPRKEQWLPFPASRHASVPCTLWIILHLMIAGRLHWRAAQAKLGGRNQLAALDFAPGSLVLTEAGAKRRASLHLLAGEEGLRSVDPGGLEVLTSDLDSFRGALMAENHTLKRVLTDPRVVSGIGNAYSDEILHAARLSPIAQTHKLTAEDWNALFVATRDTLQLWIDRLCAEAQTDFPEKVTAFRQDMAVHGRFGKPCPRCGEPILRIRYADNETNYCARCQTGGKVLADRSLSRLLGSDWPKTLDQLEALKRR